jgi:hypothetical protein
VVGANPGAVPGCPGPGEVIGSGNRKFQPFPFVCGLPGPGDRAVPGPMIGKAISGSGGQKKGQRRWPLASLRKGGAGTG